MKEICFIRQLHEPRIVQWLYYKTSHWWASRPGFSLCPASMKVSVEFASFKICISPWRSSYCPTDGLKLILVTSKRVWKNWYLYWIFAWQGGSLVQTAANAFWCSTAGPANLCQCRLVNAAVSILFCVEVELFSLDEVPVVSDRSVKPRLACADLFTSVIGKYVDFWLEDPAFLVEEPLWWLLLVALLLLEVLSCRVLCVSVVLLKSDSNHCEEGYNSFPGWPMG